MSDADGRLFHGNGAATGNEWSPKVDRLFEHSCSKVALHCFYDWACYVK